MTYVYIRFIWGTEQKAISFKRVKEWFSLLVQTAQFCFSWKVCFLIEFWRISSFLSCLWQRSTTALTKSYLKRTFVSCEWKKLLAIRLKLENTRSYFSRHGASHPRGQRKCQGRLSFLSVFAMASWHFIYLCCSQLPPVGTSRSNNRHQ